MSIMRGRDESLRHIQIPSAINNPAAGIRDRPNECSINQKDKRPATPPTCILYSSSALSFHLFPSPELLFHLSGGNSVVLTVVEKKTPLDRVKKQCDQRCDYPSLSHLLSVTRSSPVVSCAAPVCSVFMADVSLIQEGVRVGVIKRNICLCLLLSVCLSGSGSGMARACKNPPVVNCVTSSTFPTGQLLLKAYRLNGLGSLLSSPHSSWFGEVHRPARVS